MDGLRKHAQQEEGFWSQVRICGVKNRLFPFKKRPHFAFQSPALSFKSSPPSVEPNPKVTWRDAALLTHFCPAETEKVFKLLYTTLTQIHTFSKRSRVGSGTRHHHGCKNKESLNEIQEKKKKKERIVGHYFGLWARCLSDESKKKICNDCHVSSSGLVGRENAHLSRSVCGEAGKRCPTHTHTHRLTSDAEGGWWWRSKHSHTRTAAQTPLDRWNVTSALCVCVHFSKGRCGLVTCRRNNPTGISQTGKREDYF